MCLLNNSTVASVTKELKFYLVSINLNVNSHILENAALYEPSDELARPSYMGRGSLKRGGNVF